MNASTEPVSLSSPWRWLRLGWADLCRNPVPGLVHGLLVTAFGGLLLLLARDRLWLAAGAYSGGYGRRKGGNWMRVGAASLPSPSIVTAHKVVEEPFIGTTATRG